MYESQWWGLLQIVQRTEMAVEENDRLKHERFWGRKPICDLIYPIKNEFNLLILFGPSHFFMKNEVIRRRWHDCISQDTLHSDEIILFILPAKPLEFPP